MHFRENPNLSVNGVYIFSNLFLKLKYLNSHNYFLNIQHYSQSQLDLKVKMETATLKIHLSGKEDFIVFSLFALNDHVSPEEVRRHDKQKLDEK